MHIIHTTKPFPLDFAVFTQREPAAIAKNKPIVVKKRAASSAARRQLESAIKTEKKIQLFFFCVSCKNVLISLIVMHGARKDEKEIILEFPVTSLIVK